MALKIQPCQLQTLRYRLGRTLFVDMAMAAMSPARPGNTILSKADANQSAWFVEWESRMSKSKPQSVFMNGQ